MGIIQQQTLKGSFYSYLGILIGFGTQVFLLPHALNPDQLGLINIQTYLSMLFAQFAILGFNGTARYFPYFRDPKKNHNGYLFLFCTVALIGFILFSIVSFAFKDEIINQEAQKSSIFKDYYWYLIPLTFFTLYFNVLEIYNQCLYDTITGRILREFVKRLLILVPILLVTSKILTFQKFMPLWLVANMIPTILLASVLYGRQQLNLNPQLSFVTGEIRKKLVGMSLFAILTGSAPILVQSIDVLMVNRAFGLNEVAIYSIAFQFGTIITLPARSLYSISYTIIADSWKRNDLANIYTIYRKSCLNQLIAALFIFEVVWVNVDSIFLLIPPEYAAGKYVIFFIGLANLIDSATGTNGVILSTSKYFKYDSLFYLGMIGITILFNLLFIPMFGITGAAIAAAASYLVFNSFRYLFILKAFQMQPFSMKNLYVLIIGGIAYGAVYLLPRIDNLYIDVLVRSGILSAIYLLCIIGFKLSEDINGILMGYLNKLWRKTS
ncbi:lipopolysaccharide biosynthesis protein [Pedobacter sp. SYSU D00535]|uniref:lipopolysaccharide biosynthesis protein n=1 Tax=Pedobacter sp. SYSU D00535 TaxID=2810308 RepID=UPI001A968795|nr:polysaccharide biosynthesis C-terminal domain-containing protein [Pedobacter sp. SYSU D00535]